MSTIPTQVTNELFSYLIERTTPENDFSQNSVKPPLRQSIPPIWIAPEQAVFMGILLNLSKSQRVLELGTLGGYQPWLWPKP